MKFNLAYVFYVNILGYKLSYNLFLNKYVIFYNESNVRPEGATKRLESLKMIVALFEVTL